MNNISTMVSTIGGNLSGLLVQADRGVAGRLSEEQTHGMQVSNESSLQAAISQGRG